MTVIIGYVDKTSKQTYMSCDSCMSSPMLKLTMGDGTSKIYQPAENSNFLIGVCGDPRVKQLISSFVGFPREEELKLDKLVVDERFIVRNLIPAIQKALEDNLYEDSRLYRSQVLLAYKDRLWCIGPNFQLIESDSDYYTIGSGSIVANGVLEALKDDDKTNELSKIVKALKISTKLSIGVEGPYSMYLTGKGKLSDKTMSDLVSGNLITEPVTISSVDNNYIKKIVKTECSIQDISEEEDLLFITKPNSTDEIYFVDYNSNLCCIKSNGDLVFNVEPFQSLYKNEWNIVELNAKGKRLLEVIKDKYPALNLSPDPEEETE